MATEKDNPVLRLSFEFGLAIVEYAENLESNKKWVIANQLLRCGTSVGANIREAQNAESRADFIHKLKIAAKEAGESEYFLMLCESSKNYPDCKILLNKVRELNKLLSAIIHSSKNPKTKEDVSNNN